MNNPLGIHHLIAQRRAAVRAAELTLEVTQASAEHYAILAAGDAGYGKNDSERKRYLTLALAKDSSYQLAASELEAARQALDLAEADLATFSDARRAEEWRIRDQLAAALRGRYPAADETVEPFDATADEAMIAMAADFADEGARQQAYAEIGELFGDEEPDELTPAERGMSGGSLESTHYAGKPRPQPTYSWQQNLDEIECPF